MAWLLVRLSNNPNPISSFPSTSYIMSPLDMQQTEAPAPGGFSALMQTQHEKQSDNHVLVKLVEKIASEDPQRPFLSIPSSDNAQGDWKPVTFQQFNTAIDYLAHCLSQSITRKPDDEEFPTIAYIGPNDIRYCILLVAAAKTGFVVRSFL